MVIADVPFTQSVVLTISHVYTRSDFLYVFFLCCLVTFFFFVDDYNNHVEVLHRKKGDFNFCVCMIYARFFVWQPKFFFGISPIYPKINHPFVWTGEIIKICSTCTGMCETVGRPSNNLSVLRKWQTFFCILTGFIFMTHKLFVPHYVERNEWAKRST